MRTLPVVVAAALVAACALSSAAIAQPGAGTTLVELRQSARCTEATTVVRAGATLVAPSLGLYLVPNSSAGMLVRMLRLERIVGTDRLARGIAPGTADRLTFANKGHGRFAYLAVYPPKSVDEATYVLRLS